MTILYILIAIIAGAGSTYILLQGKITLLTSQLAQLSSIQTKADTLEQENKAMFGKLSQLEGQNETLKTTVENQKADEDKMRKMLTEISNESVLRQGRMLSDQQQVKLNDVLNPLKEKTFGIWNTRKRRTKKFNTSKYGAVRANQEFDKPKSNRNSKNRRPNKRPQRIQ